MWARTKAGEAWAALGRPRVAIAAIVAIALVLLHRDGYGAAKALFLAFVLAVAAVALPRAIALVRDKGAAERRLLIACAALGAWLVVSLPIALAHGTAATEWLRDASAYGLLVVAPVLAILLRSDAGPRWVGRVVVLAGAVCAASFFVYWLSVREYADLPIARLLLPSFYLPAALVAYASARALRVTGLSRAAWIAAAAAVLVVLAATGSRISAILVAAPLALLALPGRRRALAAVAAAAVVLVGVLALLGPVLGVQNSAIDRLASAKDFFVQPSNDPSWRERSQEARNAVDSWSGSPIVGVGPGHHFHWRNIRGTPHDSFLIDSPAAYLAKFGIVGVVLLLALAAALADFIRRRLREGGELAFGAEALLGFCAIALLGFFVGVPMEDKGFPLAVLLLCALAIPGRADPPGATAFRWSPRRLALAAAAAAILIAVAVLGGALSSPPPPHFVTNASTAPEHLLARFESALWHGRGAEACGLMTPAMRTRAGAGAYGGAGATCERRIGGLARGSAELGNTRVTGPIRETRDGVAWYTVSRRTVPDELYRVRRSSAPGGWAIDSFAELPARPDAPTVALADGLDAGLIGPGQAFVVNAASPPERALQRFEIALWRGKGSDACGAVTAPMRTAVVDGDYGGKPGPCERRLGTLAPNSLALVGASVSGPVGATPPSARWYLVRRPTGKSVLYRLRLRGGRWLIDGFSPLDVASEADPRARVDALGSRLIGPRDAFVVNARTAPEVALSRFESALWHGSGNAACAAATSRMRATVVGGAYGGRAGSCDRRLADLARKSLALVGGRVSGPVGQPTPSARWYTVERSSGKVVLYRLRLQGGNWLVDGFSPLAVASEADPRARVDALDSRLIGPRDAFVVNARTAPEVALSAFEGALWRGSGDAACAVATSRMRAAVVGGAFGGRPGSCGTRLGALAPKSLALVGGTVSGPVGPSTPSARWYAVERSTRTVVIYRMRLQGGRWLVDSFSPIGDRSEAAPRARADAFDLHLIGARQAFVLGARARPELLLRRFEHALWAGDGGQACSLASATLRSDIATGDYGSQGQDCQQRLGEIAKHVPQLIGSRVDRAATRVTSGRAVVSVKRWSGATVRYELRRAPGGSGWLVDRFSTTVKP